MTMRSVVMERDLPHPMDRVWRALTDGSLIQEWLMDNDFQPVVGHRFTFRIPPMPHWDGVIDCEVLAVEAPVSLSYSWRALGLDSRVDWTLAASGAGTRLRMEQSGFGPGQDAAFNGATHGWTNFLGKLEGVLADLG